MKRHKKGIVLILALSASAVVMSLVAIALPRVEAVQTDVAGTQLAPASYPTVIASADFTVHYADLGQLKKAAEVIVRGEVVGVSYLDFNSTAYTSTTFKVSECLQGGFGAGDEITIVEVGGVTTMAAVNGDKFGAPTDRDLDTKVSVLLDGAPLSEVGDKCLYFLGPGSIGVVPGAYYVPLGAFQGRFKITDSLAERFVPAGWGGEYTSLPMAEDAIDKAVLRAAPDK
jgi:hypothetical protein